MLIRIDFNDGKLSAIAWVLEDNTYAITCYLKEIKKLNDFESLARIVKENYENFYDQSY